MGRKRESQARSILDGYFNPLVFWYQWEYLRSPAKNLSFFAGYLRLAMQAYLRWCLWVSGEKPNLSYLFQPLFAEGAVYLDKIPSNHHVFWLNQTNPIEITLKQHLNPINCHEDPIQSYWNPTNKSHSSPILILFKSHDRMVWPLEVAPWVYPLVN